MGKSLQETQTISLLVAPFLDVLACSAAGAVWFACMKAAANVPGDPPESQSHAQGDGCSCTTSALQCSFPLPVSQAQRGGKDLLSNGSLLSLINPQLCSLLGSLPVEFSGVVDITHVCTCLLPLPELGNGSAGSEAAVPPLSPLSVPWHRGFLRCQSAPAFLLMQSSLFNCLGCFICSLFLHLRI